MPPRLLAIIASAGLGAIIGLVRQWSDQTENARRKEYSGVRTFTFWCILGEIAAFLSEEFSPAVLPVVLAGVSLQFVANRFHPPAENADGSTTFAAALLTLLVGALVQWGYNIEAVLVTALVVILLGLKHPIHEWTHHFTESDIRMTMQFIAVTGVILPIAPNRDLGPFGSFNPYSTWLMVVLVSGIGFGSYVLMRWLGAEKGLYLTSVLGGFTSSTATTLAFSRSSREHPAYSSQYVTAIALACTVMLPRVMIVVGLVNRQLGLHLLLPLGFMAVPGVAFSVWSFLRHREHHPNHQPAVTNPLNLSVAIKFGLLFAGLNFLVKTAAHFQWLEPTLLPLAFFTGLGDVDLISLIVAKAQIANQIDPNQAVRAVVLASIANSAVKAGLALKEGSTQLRRPIALVLLATIACGAVAFWLPRLTGEPR